MAALAQNGIIRRRERAPERAGDAARSMSQPDFRYTVVGGSSSAESVQPFDASSVAVLSARPDGRKLDMLSLIAVLRQNSAALALHLLYNACDSKNRRCKLRTGPPPDGTGAKVVTATDEKLVCAWHSHWPVYNATLFRFVCHNSYWNAESMMHASRQKLRLVLSLPGFAASVPFTTEAIADFPQGSVAGCVDFAYHEGDRVRDFNEWSLAQQMVGVDRVYVADQLRYRYQVRDQLRRGFVQLTHDYPHRYVHPGQRDGPLPPTTYDMFYKTTSAYNFLCLHEHWYDDWVFVSYSTDEFFTFLGDTAPPTKGRERLVSAKMDLFWERHHAPKERSTGGWSTRARTGSFCAPMLCVNRPFYGPTNLVSGETWNWTLPGKVCKIEGLPCDQSYHSRLRYGSEEKLSIERFTKRFSILPPRGSVRKCFVHPDWRLGSRLKVHGFTMQACPLAGVVSCQQAWPDLKYVCLQLCGYWGRETAPANASCAGFENGGMMLRSMELAHFRVAPKDNQKHGYKRSDWLAKLAPAVRQGLVEIRKSRKDGEVD